MSLYRGTGIRIVTKKDNIFGKVLKDNGNSITIKLSKTYTIGNLCSDLIEIVHVDTEKSLKPISQYYSIEINGVLINEMSGEKKHLLTGIATID